MSGQLPWLKDGAELSFVLSPLNTNVGCSMLLLEVMPLELELLLLEADELDGRSNAQGTGTSFSPVVVVFAPLVELEEEVLPLLAAELSWMTAKSMRPEFGLIITSLMVPS